MYHCTISYWMCYQTIWMCHHIPSAMECVTAPSECVPIPSATECITMPPVSECVTLPPASGCTNIPSATECVTVPSECITVPPCLTHGYILPLKEQPNEFTSESWITNFTPPRMTFPQKWNCFSDSSNTQLCIYKIEDMNANGSTNPSTQHSLVISHSIAINQNLTWSLNVNRQQVDTALCTCLASVPSVWAQELYQKCWNLLKAYRYVQDSQIVTLWTYYS